MSTYDDASLVLVPSGYKNGIVFSQKPMDANGQLTFTRASSATRVASDGLIEKVRTNLALQSQTFDNASWVPNNTTVTANAETAPDGTLTADTMTLADSTSYVSQPTALGAGTYTISCYVKVISTTTAGEVRFNIVYDATSINLTFTPTGDWQRVEGTFTATTGVTTLRIRGGFGTAFVGTLAIWGFQAEVSDFGPTDYIPTTTAAVSVGPVSGLPRLDYLNSSCPKLLLEPQRTNLALFSEQFDNAAWTKLRASVTANVSISPDGYQNADKLIEDTTASNTHILVSGVSLSSAFYVMSVFAKASERTEVGLFNGSSTDVAIFNLSTGTVIQSGTHATKIENYGNGWYRCSIGSTTTTPLRVAVSNGGTISYTGNGTAGILIYGAQIEIGAYATSYIPTLGTSVTRVADACSKTGISSLIGQTEGTLFVEFEINATNTDGLNRILSVTDGTGNNRVLILAGTSETFRFIVTSAGSSIINFISSTSVLGGRHKVAFAYKASEYAAYVDGVQLLTDTSSVVPTTLNSVFVGCNESTLAPIEGTISQALLFKTRLDNATLQSLTTL
jgi:hypothetical protein